MKIVFLRKTISRTESGSKKQIVVDMITDFRQKGSCVFTKIFDCKLCLVGAKEKWRSFLMASFIFLH